MLVVTRRFSMLDQAGPHPENTIILERGDERIVIVAVQATKSATAARIGIEADRSWNIRRGELPRDETQIQCPLVEGNGSGSGGRHDP